MQGIEVEIFFASFLMENFKDGFLYLCICRFVIGDGTWRQKILRQRLGAKKNIKWGFVQFVRIFKKLTFRILNYTLFKALQIYLRNK
jgi:hypothetical protein